MTETGSPEHEQSLRRSKTAGSLSNRNRKQSANMREGTSRSSIVPPVRSTSPYRHNKLYHCPRTPPSEVQFNRERSFVLDCKAVSNISNDYSTANPKLGSVIPPYNALLDHHVDSYFKFFGVRELLKKSRPKTGHESVAGRAHDRFYTSGHGFRYLARRNKFGSGHSIHEVRGHDLFLSDLKPIVNYNGLFGYRRNTPALRQQPSIGTKQVDAYNNLPFGRYSVIGFDKSYSFHCECKFDQPCRCHNQDKLCPCVKA